MTLLECDEHLSLLRTMLHDSEGGSGGAALVTGAVGSGKTALLTAFGQQCARSGVRWLSAVGSRAERDLPHAVIRQIFESSLPYRSRDDSRVARSLDAAQTAHAPGSGAEGRLMHELWMELVRISEDQPVLVSVDDVHDADRPSLRQLLYFARRLCNTRILMVVAKSDCLTRVDPDLDIELLRQPYARQLRLTPLTRQGVTALIAERIGAHPADELATSCHTASRGNPLLVTALLDDIRAPSGGSAVGPNGLVIGETFAQAMLTYLHRHSTALAVAQGLAVLSRDDGDDVLSSVVGTDPASVKHVVDELTAIGLLEAGRFRYQVTRSAILNNLRPDERSTLHSKAAVCLNEVGSAPLQIARHLIASGQVPDWAGAVLREGAAQAVAAGDLELAISCLSLGVRGSRSRAERAHTTLLLAQAEWRRDPFLVARHFDLLTAGVRAGDLTGEHAHRVVRYLLWSGRFDQAADLLSHVHEGDDPSSDRTTESQVTQQLLSCSFPQLAGASGLPTSARTKRQFSDASVSRKCLATAALRSVLSTGPNATVIAGAEEVLRSPNDSDTTLEAVEPALFVLIYADSVEKAAYWCGRLAEESRATRAETWNAVLCSIQAEIALRQGQLPNAAELAGQALDLLSHRGWGAVVTFPLACLVRANSEMGRYDEAERLLQRQIPRNYLNTRFGLHYLHARGVHYSATGRPLSALSDFTACGEYMSRWGIDQPSLVPWRARAAQAHIKLEQRTEARRLLELQLSKLDTRLLRARGTTLRMLAEVLATHQRPELLRASVASLQPSGDRLELAYTLTSLGAAFDEAGDLARARLVRREALDIATECGAAPLRRDLLSAGVRDSDWPTEADDLPDGHDLSSAERRVASLAASGHTNREISEKLFVTVSTVEQHLTRTYRKLKVAGRADLPTGQLRRPE